MESHLLRPLADAFLQVGVPVGLLVVLVGLAQVRWGTRALDVLVRHPRAAPVLGALLGVTPGCGGAILAAGLYLKRRASYGTAVAALTATMGDASFVLLAVDLRTGLVVHAVLLVSGVVTGLAVDAVGWDPRREREPAAALAAAGGPPRGSAASSGAFAVPSDDGCGARAAGTTAVPVAVVALWAAVALGAVVATPVVLGLADSSSLRLLGLDAWLVVGVAGALACLAVFLRADCRLRDDGEQVPGTSSAALLHGAVETAFVVVWVAAAFVALAVLGAVLPWDGSVLPLAGAVGVVVGVVVALVPGCGTQIAFTGLWAAGALPLPALLANAVAQDGDALLPVLARDRRTAVVTTAVTSLPALVVGLLAVLVL